MIPFWLCFIVKSFRNDVLYVFIDLFNKILGRPAFPLHGSKKVFQVVRLQNKHPFYSASAGCQYQKINQFHQRLHLFQFVYGLQVLFMKQVDVLLNYPIAKGVKGVDLHAVCIGANQSKQTFRMASTPASV